MTQKKTVAIVGNPNCGKTTLFNKLTGSHQKVGNWAGVTVERKEGFFTHQRQKVTLVDLPGIYSLNVASKTHAIDEQIACQYILAEQADLVINILDGANLKRNLYLTVQLLEMGVPCIVAVNMLDIASQRNISIDCDKLSFLLNCPVVPLVSIQNKGIDELKQAIVNYHTPAAPLFSVWCEQVGLKSPKVAEAVQLLGQQIHQYYPQYQYTMPYALAIKLLEQDAFAEEIINHAFILTMAENLRENLVEELHEDVDILIADDRYSHIQKIVTAVCEQGQIQDHGLTHWLDKIVLNRFLGIPIFLFVMYLMFEFSMDVGAILKPFFDQGSTTLFVDGMQYLGNHYAWPTWLTAIMANGVGLGINTVVTFIPQIGLMFLFLSFLEDSGYMARAAFVMDRFMQAVGLPGKSFIPLIVGFGCNVPSIMATRTLENPRDRLLTILMTPFMSCGARLAIFVVFGAAFFPHHAGLMVFALYLIGIMAAMLTGFLLKFIMLKGEAAPFILELPTYHIPHFTTIFLLTWQRLKGFILRAGKFIVPICVLIGTLNAVAIDGTINANGSQQSILSYVGKSITPALYPMGVRQDNWPAAVGLITGTLAKEVVVGTLNTLYTQNNEDAHETQFDLVKGLESAWQQSKDSVAALFSASMLNPFTANEGDHEMTTSAMGTMQKAFGSPIAAFTYLLFVLLYIPCASTMGTIAREIGARWAYFSSVWCVVVAYTTAVIFFQLVSFMHHPMSSSLWIGGLLTVNLLGVLYLKYGRFSIQAVVSTTC